MRRRREIDANWFEGTNSKGQIGIFPKCYVQDSIEGAENGDDAAGSVIPDRPKTPKITTATNYSRSVFFKCQNTSSFTCLSNAFIASFI